MYRRNLSECHRVIINVMHVVTEQVVYRANGLQSEKIRRGNIRKIIILQRAVYELSTG